MIYGTSLVCYLSRNGQWCAKVTYRFDKLVIESGANFGIILHCDLLAIVVKYY